jgi:hypothetical protein
MSCRMFVKMPGALTVGAAIALLTMACTAGPGKGQGGDGDGSKGDGDGDNVDVNDEEFLTTCVGAECPSGTREGVRQVCTSSRVGPRLLRRLTRDELRNTLDDVFPEVAGAWGGVRLSQDPVSALGFSSDAKALVVNGPTFKNMLDTAEALASAVTGPDILALVLPCAVTSADEPCAAEFVNRYGLRLFRRPLTGDEVTRYLDYQQSVASRSNFATGTKWALSAMLQSPHAIYRSEIGEPDAQGAELTQYEIATNLAYTYSSTPPDLALLAKAQAGQLASAEAREAVADALIQERENWETSRKFFREWLGYTRVINQSREQLADFAGVISPLLVEETRLFLDQILFGGGTVQELLTTDFTALNDKLTEFYGYGSVSGASFEPVVRPPNRGRGLLSQGSLLAATSHQAETSPTLRGLLFTENFLCIEPPPPPDIIPPLSEAEGIENARTTREKYEIHHSVGGCANCHRHFDPYGFVFEQFDETGRFRADEHGVPIDTAATVILPGGATRGFSDLDELSDFVNESDDIENCISGLMATYFLSAGGGANCLAEDARRALAAGEISLKQYLISLASAPHFTRRAL